MDRGIFDLLDSTNFEDNQLGMRIILRTRNYPDWEWKHFRNEEYNGEGSDLEGMYYLYGGSSFSVNKLEMFIKNDDGTYDSILTNWAQKYHFHRNMNEHTFQDELKWLTNNSFKIIML